MHMHTTLLWSTEPQKNNTRSLFYSSTSGIIVQTYLSLFYWVICFSAFYYYCTTVIKLAQLSSPSHNYLPLLLVTVSDILFVCALCWSTCMIGCLQGGLWLVAWFHTSINIMLATWMYFVAFFYFLVYLFYVLFDFMSVEILCLLGHGSQRCCTVWFVWVHDLLL